MKGQLLFTILFFIGMFTIWVLVPKIEIVDCTCECVEEIIEIPVTGTYSFEYDPCTGLVRHSGDWVKPGMFELRRIP